MKHINQDTQCDFQGHLGATIFNNFCIVWGQLKI